MVKIDRIVDLHLVWLLLFFIYFYLFCFFMKILDTAAALCKVAPEGLKNLGVDTEVSGSSTR
jgi:hypothetical protein